MILQAHQKRVLWLPQTSLLPLPPRSLPPLSRKGALFIFLSFCSFPTRAFILGREGKGSGESYTPHLGLNCHWNAGSKASFSKFHAPPPHLSRFSLISGHRFPRPSRCHTVTACPSTRTLRHHSRRHAEASMTVPVCVDRRAHPVFPFPPVYLHGQILFPGDSLN